MSDDAAGGGAAITVDDGDGDGIEPCPIEEAQVARLRSPPATPPSRSRSLLGHAVIDTGRARGDHEWTEESCPSASAVDVKQSLELIAHRDGVAGSEHTSNDVAPSPSAASTSADQTLTQPPRPETPSVVMHTHWVYAHETEAVSDPTLGAGQQAVDGATPETAASASSVAPAAAPVTSVPSAAQWRDELRAMWEAGAEASAASAAAKRKQAQEAALRPERLPLSASVQALPPLQGDIVWNAKPARRVTVAEYEDYLRSSKLSHWRLHRMSRQILSMFLPVLVLCALILTYSLVCVKNEHNTMQAWKILVYKQKHEDSTLRKFTGSLLNGLTVLAAIVAITAVFITLYALQWKKALRYFLTCVIFALIVPWVYFAYQVVSYHSIPVDWVSSVLFVWNFFAVGMVGLVAMAETASNLNRAFLIAVAVSVSWPFMEFPEWTVWTTLIVLTIYDLIAVLAPCGPLKYIMDAEAAAKSRPPSEGEAPLPGMMYRGEFFMLGLGDLVFYGALMGRAAHAGVVTLAATCLGVLAGLAGTILWSHHTTAHAIPALPLSVLCGLLCYAATALAIVPFVEQAALRGWQI